jgi:hypothetical protein
MATSSFFIAIITTISFICFALSCAAVFLPIWGYFEDAHGGFGSDRGYFGPWKVCKELAYNREKCGSFDNASRFKPSNFVFASGLAIVLSTICLGIYCILSVIQIAAVSSREKIVMKYSTLVSVKVILAFVGGKLISCADGGKKEKERGSSASQDVIAINNFFLLYLDAFF